MTDQFYMHLPSNSSQNIYPENTAASYKVKLPSIIDLNSSYEVALAEISYSVSFNNMPEGQSFRIAAYSGSDGSDIGEGEFSILHGYYQDSRELVDAMSRKWTDYWIKIKRSVGNQQELRESQKEVVPAGTRLDHAERLRKRRADSAIVPDMKESSLTISLNQFTNRVVFKLDSSYYVLKLTEELQDILKIDDDSSEYNGNNKKYISQTAVDLNYGNRSLFVYCSVASESVVGNVRVPLLRSFPLTGKKSGSTNESFTRLQYVPLKTSIFDTIEIELRTELGNLLDFNFGYTNCVLHFRRAAPRVLL